ncbi:site-specific integrase [Adhaeribacter terreus]|uniref:Site-specific integrase n=1 Tax=Adhaeribacter terreus TaxID=529703 RepID=A0ABW0EAN9_9BACT
MPTKVKLRAKPISGGRKSLYLDFYPAIPHPETGSPTRREFLNLYLFEKPKSPVDKQHNKDTQTLAEQIRQKRDNHLNKPEIYTGFEKEQLRLKEISERSFLEYFEQLKRKRAGSNHDNWVSAFHYLETFTGSKLTFADLNETFCNEYREYLLNAKSHKRTKTPLAQNTALSYFNKFKAALRQAFQDGLLPTDLNGKIKGIKPGETQRHFLTLEELNALVKTDCANPQLKQAALFSALTGLRFSDIAKLVWSELEYMEGQGYFIRFRQQKTKGTELQPISDQAFQLLGQPAEPTEQVFSDLQYSAYQNTYLKDWIRKAGITKPITFHCFRHTFATLQLSQGTDIYTVSKMLGHRELKTTQVYAKVIDQTKRTAADKIKLDF